MTVFYLLGGENLEKRDSMAINQSAFRTSGKGVTVLAFPWSWPEEDASYRKRMIDYFSVLGAKKTIFAELSDELSTLQSKAYSADILYLPGGLSEVLTKNLRSKGVEGLIREFKGAVIGNSAGANCLCKKYIERPGKDGRVGIKVYDGLGILDFAVLVHWNPDDRDALKKISRVIPLKIYAIPERCAVVYHDQATPIGEVEAFKDGQLVMV